MAFFSTDTILETINMIKLHNLDIRTVTLALSLRDCASENVKVCADKIRKKISKYAKNLGTFATEIEQEYSIPISLFTHICFTYGINSKKLEKLLCSKYFDKIN